MTSKSYCIVVRVIRSWMGGCVAKLALSIFLGLAALHTSLRGHSISIIVIIGTSHILLHRPIQDTIPLWYVQRQSRTTGSKIHNVTHKNANGLQESWKGHRLHQLNNQCNGVRTYKSSHTCFDVWLVAYTIPDRWNGSYQSIWRICVLVWRAIRVTFSFHK